MARPRDGRKAFLNVRVEKGRPYFTVRYQCSPGAKRLSAGTFRDELAAHDRLAFVRRELEAGRDPAIALVRIRAQLALGEASRRPHVREVLEEAAKLWVESSGLSPGPAAVFLKLFREVLELADVAQLHEQPVISVGNAERKVCAFAGCSTRAVIALSFGPLRAPPIDYCAKHGTFVRATFRVSWESTIETPWPSSSSAS